MHHSLRNGIALCCWGWVVALYGCTNRLGPVRATQSAGSIDHPNLPDITVEQSRECVAEYAHQLAPGRVVLDSRVEVDEDGYKVGVSIDGIPETAPDFGACMRNVLRAMPIAEQPFVEGVEALKYRREHARDGRDSFHRFIEVIPGVPIVESELVLEVEGYTVVLPVTVKVVGKLETFINGDKRTLAKLGQQALDTLGYDEIMKRAEQIGWVKTVPIERGPSAAAKKFLGDAPLPPNASAVAEAAFKKVMSKAAPAALLSSQADSPAPGPGDVVAVGIFAIALVAVGAITAYELVTASSTATTTAAAPIPVNPPRRWPNQTCEDAELDRLEEVKKALCKPDEGLATKCPKDISKPKIDKIPCSAVKLSIQQRQACLAARWDVQNKCFGGKPDPGHKDQIDQVQNGIDNCEALKLKVCAQGHPMAGK